MDLRSTALQSASRFIVKVVLQPPAEQPGMSTESGIQAGGTTSPASKCMLLSFERPARSPSWPPCQAAGELPLSALLENCTAATTRPR
jgi:hypothetical protein